MSSLPFSGRKILLLHLPKPEKNVLLIVNLTKKTPILVDWFLQFATFWSRYRLRDAEILQFSAC